MTVSSIVTYVDSKDAGITEQVGPVPFSAGNPPNGWGRLMIDHWDENGTYASGQIFLGPASYASFVEWLGFAPAQQPTQVEGEGGSS